MTKFTEEDMLRERAMKLEYKVAYLQHVVDMYESAFGHITNLIKDTQTTVGRFTDNES